MLAFNPAIAQLHAYGTDGETALAKAVAATFQKAKHLRCFLHFKGNVEHKLRELGIPLNISKEFISDIMGRASYLQYGLVDAKNSEDLKMMLEGVKVRWNELEKPYNSLPKFYNWFVKHCLSVITECMIQGVHQNGGLGSPPEPYYTNEVESKNKSKKRYNTKKSDLPEFVQKMSNLMHEQKQEIEWSVINSGEYRVREEYQQYAVDSTRCF